MNSALESTDAKNKLEDLSGVVLKPGENPYHALIDTCHNDPAEIQVLYATHRVTRNAQQKEKYLTSDFKELIIDPFLYRLENPSLYPGFVDPRNCMVLWARPPDHIVKLASHLQSMLKATSPNLWLMPPHRMHLTALEVDHSRTPDEIASLLAALRPTSARLASYTHDHRARLVRPMLSYDLAAVAVSFLPAAGHEKVLSPAPVPPQPDDRQTRDDGYTYHHLRRDLFVGVREAGADIVSRYVVPSAHITLCRFLSQDDHATPEARARWVQKIDEINAWLEREVWDRGDSDFLGEWIVGQEKGLDFRVGQLWYGGGRTVIQGEGF